MLKAFIFLIFVALGQASRVERLLDLIEAELAKDEVAKVTMTNLAKMITYDKTPNRAASKKAFENHGVLLKDFNCKVDKDKDGKITADEISEYFQSYDNYPNVEDDTEGIKKAHDFLVTCANRIQEVPCAAPFDGDCCEYAAPVSTNGKCPADLWYVPYGDEFFLKSDYCTCVKGFENEVAESKENQIAMKKLLAVLKALA